MVCQRVGKQGKETTQVREETCVQPNRGGRPGPVEPNFTGMTGICWVKFGVVWYSGMRKWYAGGFH